MWQLMSYAFGPLIKMKKGQHRLHNREEMFFLIQTAHFGLSQINGHNELLNRHTIPTVMILLPLGQSVWYSMKRTRSVYEKDPQSVFLNLFMQHFRKHYISNEQLMMNFS